MGVTAGRRVDREDPIWGGPSSFLSMVEERSPRGPTRTIELPEDLVRELAERIRGSSFESVDAFVTFVLARLTDEPSGTAFSEEDERHLKERLRSLGYID